MYQKNFYDIVKSFCDFIIEAIRFPAEQFI